MPVVSIQDNLHEMYRMFSWWHFEVFFLCYPENRCRLFIHIISTGLHFPCKLSSVEICVKCQTCFTGENKKRGNEFAICWVSPESDKGSTGQWIIDIIHSVGDMCRPRSDCAEMPVHLGLSCSQIPKGRFLFLFQGTNIYSTRADQTRSACAAGSRSKIFNTSLNYVEPVNCHYCFE